MSTTKRRIAARRHAWGRGPHLLAFARPEDRQAPSPVPPTGILLAFPGGERAERLVADRHEVATPAAPIALIGADGSRREFPVETPPFAPGMQLRLHDAMAN